jgi:alkanesulfonate monooxygenase SsuD/methylene tetrahydromethanopterin reductase-like flavin-dependent oxidoreductase (luciferase family)
LFFPRQETLLKGQAGWYHMLNRCSAFTAVERFPLKFSFLCSQTYLDPELFAHDVGWPNPPANYDRRKGLLSVELAFEEAELAEELGFDMVTVSEHHYWPIIVTPNAAVLAAALTQRLKRVRIGWMGPLVSMSNPVRIAEEAMMLDQLSNGRLSLLFLRGTPNEFLAYGINADETRARTQEAVELITMAMTEPRPFTWEGRFFRFPTVSVWPGPTQLPHPPIFSSGNSPASLQFAAKHHQSMAMSFYPQKLVVELTDAYRDACKEHGWSPTSDQILYRGYVACTETDAEAKEIEKRFYGSKGLAGSMMGGRADSAADQRAQRVTEVQKFVAQRSPQPSELGTDADGKGAGVDSKGKAAGFALGTLAFCGSPDTVAEQIRQFHEATGVGIFDLGFAGGGTTREERLRSLKLFGEEVMPKLKDVGLPTKELNNAG